MTSDDDTPTDGLPRNERDELARQRRFEELQAQAQAQLEQIRNDPRVRQSLDDYEKEYGGGDPSWWKPEYEVANTTESERIEHMVASVPERVRDLSHTIASVVVNISAGEHERLSRETGLTLAELQSLSDCTLPGAAHVALRLAHQVQAIGAACGQYGLPRDEFEALPTGPRDRTAGTLVGRQARPAPQKLTAAKEGITGTAQIAVPNEVLTHNPAAAARQASEESAAAVEAPAVEAPAVEAPAVKAPAVKAPAHTPAAAVHATESDAPSAPALSLPMKRRVALGWWGGLIAILGLLVLVYVLQSGDETRGDTLAGDTTASTTTTSRASSAAPSTATTPAAGTGGASPSADPPTPSAAPLTSSPPAPPPSRPSSPAPPPPAPTPRTVPIPEPPRPPPVQPSTPPNPVPPPPKPSGSGLIFRPE